jgi:hypothetical protein
MVDSIKKPDNSSSVREKDNLINRIDELENLLAKKKKEAQQANTPRLKVGTDGIPVLVNAVTEEGLNPETGSSFDSLNKDDQIINDIIDKVDKEISEDLDELIVMLKDSIIDEVKTRLLKELHINKDKKDNTNS